MKSNKLLYRLFYVWLAVTLHCMGTVYLCGQDTPPRAIPVQPSEDGAHEDRSGRTVLVIDPDEPAPVIPRAIPVEPGQVEDTAELEEEVVEELVVPGRSGMDGLPINPSQPVQLNILAPKHLEILNTSKVDVFLDLRNYVLKEGGNRIHLILNNEPPIVVNDAVRPVTFERLSDGGNTVRVMVVRPDGTLLRDPEAYAMVHFYVRRRDFNNYTDPNQPYLTVNLPVEGEVGTDEMGRIAFDYIIHNVDWSNGPRYRLRYRIGSFEGFLDEQGPVFWSNLTTGRHTLQVELFDQNGQAVFGPFNRVERQFQVRQILRASPVENWTPMD